LGRASAIILKYRVNNKVLTHELFEKEFSNPSVICEFYAFMEEMIHTRRGDPLTDSSAEQHLSTLSKLKQFRPSALMVDIDEQFVRDFKKFLKIKLKNGDNTIYNTLKNFRTYINIAIKKELMEVSPFKNYQLKKVETYPEFLSERELNSLIDLYNRNFLPERFQKVLRYYLFACQTGLRISDLRNARHEMIENNMLSFKPIKTLNTTNKRVDIPLTKFALKLIKDENSARTKGLLFDCITEQRMNLYLKNILKETSLKIIKELSFHSARHTFATLFLKKIKQANGILILQRLLGHKKMESTMIYSHVLDSDVRNAINEFSG
jgi:integrase